MLQICLTTSDLRYLPDSNACCQSSVWVQTNPIIALLEWNPKTRGNIWAQIFLQLSFFLFKHAPELGNFYNKKRQFKKVEQRKKKKGNIWLDKKKKINLSLLY